MLNEPTKLWIEALREGGYKQGRGRLRNQDEFCCLGVACEVALKAGVISFYTPENGGLPIEVLDWLGLSNREGRYFTQEGMTYLTCKNDNGVTFAEIADIIASEPRDLFAKVVEENS